MGLIVLLLVLVFLLACANGGVILRHPDGRADRCGPYEVVAGRYLTQEQLRDCIKDYQRQEYERTPN